MQRDDFAYSDFQLHCFSWAAWNPFDSVRFWTILYGWRTLPRALTYTDGWWFA